jgi:hypothetical protein
LLERGQPVFATYRHGLLRLDSIVLTRAGRIVLRPGEAKPAAPVPPALAEDERRLANVWLPGRIRKLEPEHLFPVLETVFPEPPRESPTSAEKFAPRTMEKLRPGHCPDSGVGDSVTSAFVPTGSTSAGRISSSRGCALLPQGANRTRHRAWADVASYLAEPPGSEHNYAGKSARAKPDLIVWNRQRRRTDRGKGRGAAWESFADFKAIGAEWIILRRITSGWIDGPQRSEIDDDPRPYVKGLRQFTAKHQLALAEPRCATDGCGGRAYLTRR